MLSILFGLGTLIPALALPSAPFCVLQLALCKYCKGRLVPMLPLMVSGAGLAGSCFYMVEASGVGALAGFFVLVPSLLGMTGSALGWLIWRFAEEHLY